MKCPSVIRCTDGKFDSSYKNKKFITDDFSIDNYHRRAYRQMNSSSVKATNDLYDGLEEIIKKI